MAERHDRPGPVRSLQEELQVTLARYQSILASTLHPVITTDAWGVIQSASDSVERVFGWAPADLVGRNVTVLMPEPYRSYHDAYLAEYRRTGLTNIIGRPRQFHAVRRDGSLLSIELSVARVDVPGLDQPLFTAIIRDVTQQVRAEEELQRHREHLEELVAERTDELEASHEQLRMADRLATIGTLAAGLGHDMNNILLPMRCRLDALDTAALPAEARNHFLELRRSLEFLQHLADGLHLLALDPNETEASAMATSLPRWWEHVGALLARGLPRHVVLTCDLPHDLPPVAIAPHRLTQAVLNLVVNAGEAVGPDGRVRLWAEPVEQGQFVRVGVTDNGSGMSPEVKRRAMDPFFTTKKRGLGTGLGLSLVQGVTRSAGGSVHVDSAPGCGTTILLTLPVAGAVLPRRADGQVVRAAVTVDDARLASLVTTLLQSAGATDIDGNVGASHLWVTDATEAALDRAYAYVEQPGRRLVVLRGDPRWKSLGVSVVDDPSDFQVLRDRIHEALKHAAGRQEGGHVAAHSHPVR